MPGILPKTDAISDTVRLKVCYLVQQDRYKQARERCFHRRELVNNIKRYAHDGRIVVVESGMDCDGVQYSGKVHIIPASAREFDRLQDKIAEWADGPFRLQIVSAAAKIEYRQIDLAAQAFENGHPHLLKP